MHVNLSNFLFSLGISEVGEVTAKNLADKYKSIDNLINARYEDIIELRDIGPIAAENIFNFFQDKNNIKLIQSIINSGLKFKNSKKVIYSNISDQIYVITGKLKNKSREELKDLIINSGGRVSSSVTKKTHALIVGDNPGSKLQKANEFGIKVISEEKFYENLAYEK